ncbi:hypothetical protein N7456_006601 [Penicillium angulare]|uniref:Uncharacterized protein n=1 Tax=Penicillium angulare TaxID=116970 RepID=A0A9W9FI31_9EURO|nr:hypothetical protein N7456_006601 [Penicillium angulare]
MAEESMPRGEIVGIVIGAVALFSLISFLPMAIMWQHRRRAASRRASEILHLTSSMEQVSVERWLEQQNVPGDTALYCQDMWYVFSITFYPKFSRLNRAYVLARGVVIHCGECPGLGHGSSCPIGSFSITTILVPIWAFNNWTLDYVYSHIVIFLGKTDLEPCLGLAPSLWNMR